MRPLAGCKGVTRGRGPLRCHDGPMDGTFFCSGDGRQAGLWYLAAGYRDTTGNTGSSSAPHLHFHVTDSPAGNGVLANGVPYVFTDFLLTGKVLNLDEWLSQEVSVPAEIGDPAPPMQRRDQLPLQTDIVTFP